MSRRIAVVPGDGIGQEVIPAGAEVLKLLDQRFSLGLELVNKDWGAERYLKTGRGMPEDTLADLEANYDAVFFGALGDARVPDMAHGREILLGMRQGLDLFANVRPISVRVPALCPLKNADDIDFVVVRENTEDLYVSLGGRFKAGTDDEVAIDESMNTYKGVERVVRYAFELAMTRKNKRVTLSDKSNAIRHGGALWQRVFKAVATEFPEVSTDHLFVDVAAMKLVEDPQRFSVIVCNNLFGDILSDLGAALVGSLGLAASANLHPGKIGLFEPVHGSAPDIAGQGRANPIATFLTAVMMLEFLDAKAAADALSAATVAALEAGVVTADLGGTANTDEVKNFVLEQIS